MTDEIQTGFNQSLWAVSDPNWGSPVIIPETVRAGQAAAEDAFLWMSEHSLYHGGSEIAQKKGNMQIARKNGYKLVRIRITPSEVEVVG